ncbi:MAG: hypothetical protein KJ731_10540 [Alphaproteobacteria bacterium]|nr:hypothetical protein [Alphaproteobacteria bacterium]MBU1277934.1 hypothetical protein [Alphaproteobacteria bacterium]MBU1573925.1 hypothetical protein [Alphaproteobacteria bacterium]MBU1828893.1 hypothetical protein [Alphaproteobacteria bacterium]MBU2079484.1 hypothetical protein [Alphaproteobacteria bacterium]
MSKRKQHAPEFKAKLMLESLKSEETAIETSQFRYFGFEKSFTIFEQFFRGKNKYEDISYRHKAGANKHKKAIRPQTSFNLHHNCGTGPTNDKV